MAEFNEVIRQFNRMCNNYDCNDCPFDSNCQFIVIRRPNEAEEIIMNWAKEHPIKTNADKFKEVFGIEYYNDSGTKCDGIKCPSNETHSYLCSECEYKDFWDKEYIGD